MTKIWVLAETRDGEVKRSSYELIGAAKAFDANATVCVVVVGASVSALATDLGTHGADEVIAIEDPRLAEYSADGLAPALAALASEKAPELILCAATARGRDLVPRLAAELGVGVASDVVEIERGSAGEVEAVRPIYAGKALTRVRIKSRPAVVTVRPNSYPPCETAAAGTLQTLPLGDYSARAVSKGIEAAKSERPDVAEADVIVSGGRGMGGPEHFAMLETLADELEAAVGASRAVVDAGWRPHGDQVGQTGKTVSPSLYVACGISGAVQHLAGMKTSKYIVAINKDEEAPISPWPITVLSGTFLIWCQP